MTLRHCVIDASPLIVFQRIGYVSLLPNLLQQVFIPPAVRREAFGRDPLPEWLEEHALTQPLASQIAAARLGAGESEAIALALELKVVWLTIDDLAARRLAQSLAIGVIGSVGLLLSAKVMGLIPAVRPLMEAMQSVDFRVSDSVFTKVLLAAGEA